MLMVDNHDARTWVGAGQLKTPVVWAWPVLSVPEIATHQPRALHCVRLPGASHVVQKYAFLKRKEKIIKIDGLTVSGCGAPV